MKNLDSIEPELKELVQRVMIHYENPTEYLEKNLKWLSELYPKFKEYYQEKLNELLKDKEIKQVIAVANSGLWLGAIAKSLNYDVRILDVHRPLHFQKYKRRGVIHWYFILPEIISEGYKIYDLSDVSKVIRSEEDIKVGIKMGVMDFDRVEQGQRTVIVDGDVEQGFSIAVAHRRALDLGAEVIDKIVISNHTKLPGVIALDEL